MRAYSAIWRRTLCKSPVHPLLSVTDTTGLNDRRWPELSDTQACSAIFGSYYYLSSISATALQQEGRATTSSRATLAEHNGTGCRCLDQAVDGRAETCRCRKLQLL
jgi:hypothetical protein